MQEPPSAPDQARLEPLPPRSMLALALVFEGALGLVAWLLGKLLGQKPWADLHWDQNDALLGVAATLPMLALFVATVRWPVGPLTQIKEVSEQFIRPLFARCSILDLALISAAAGLGEELLFRGFLQASLEDRFGRLAGVGVASTVFGLLHFITPTYALYAGLVGSYLGLAWLWSGNLLVVIVAHALYDFLALVYLVRGKPGSL